MPFAGCRWHCSCGGSDCCWGCGAQHGKLSFSVLWITGGWSFGAVESSLPCHLLLHCMRAISGEVLQPLDRACSAANLAAGCGNGGSYCILVCVIPLTLQPLLLVLLLPLMVPFPPSTVLVKPVDCVTSLLLILSLLLSCACAPLLVMNLLLEVCCYFSQLEGCFLGAGWGRKVL